MFKLGDSVNTLDKSRYGIIQRLSDELCEIRCIIQMPFNDYEDECFHFLTHCMILYSSDQFDKLYRNWKTYE